MKKLVFVIALFFVNLVYAEDNVNVASEEDVKQTIKSLEQRNQQKEDRLAKLAEQLSIQPTQNYEKTRQELIQNNRQTIKNLKIGMSKKQVYSKLVLEPNVRNYVNPQGKFETWSFSDFSILTFKNGSLYSISY